MASSDNNSVRDESYQLNEISLQDSHVENFYAYCSPSVLVRNKGWMLEANNHVDDHNLTDDVEQRRVTMTSRSNVPTNHSVEEFTLMENSQGYYEDDYLYGNNQKNSNGSSDCSSNQRPLIVIINNNSNPKESYPSRRETKSSYRNWSSASSLKLSSMHKLRLEETFSCHDSQKMSDWMFKSIINDVEGDDEQESNKENEFDLSENIIQKKLEFLEVTPMVKNNQDHLTMMSRSFFKGDEDHNVGDNTTEFFLSLNSTNFIKNTTKVPTVLANKSDRQDEMESSTSQPRALQTSSLLNSRKSNQSYLKEAQQAGKSPLPESSLTMTCSKKLTPNNDENVIKEIDKANQKVKSLNEVATQTSFLVIDDLNSNKQKRHSLVQPDTIHKQKLKQMIQVQKHEKKYRELERRARCEWAEAERIRRQMLESEIEDCSILNDRTSSLNNQLLVSKNINFEKTKGVAKASRISLDRGKLTPENREENLSDLTIVSSVNGDVSAINATNNNTIQSRVEVFEISKSSIEKPTKSRVMIVKENNLPQIRPKVELKNNIEKNVDNKQPIKFNKLKPIAIAPIMETNRMEIDKSDAVVCKDNGLFLSSLSLQQAFEKYKHDMIERSEKRQLVIQERSKRRKEQAENEKKCVVEKCALEMKLKRERILAMSLNRPSVNIGKKRRFSASEIKEITRKNYEKLPEVKQKHKLENLEKTKRLNKIRLNVYNKAVQQHLFTKGPNFELNCKTLEKK